MEGGGGGWCVNGLVGEWMAGMVLFTLLPYFGGVLYTEMIYQSRV